MWLQLLLLKLAVWQAIRPREQFIFSHFTSIQVAFKSSILYFFQAAVALCYFYFKDLTVFMLNEWNTHKNTGNYFKNCPDTVGHTIINCLKELKFNTT